MVTQVMLWLSAIKTISRTKIPRLQRHVKMSTSRRGPTAVRNDFAKLKGPGKVNKVESEYRDYVFRLKGNPQYFFIYYCILPGNTDTE